ncbi:MAG: DUF167 domain-containing protein [archaeon]
MQIEVTVKPNASKTKITSQNDNNYKIDVKASPENNKANIELINFLTKHFKKKVKIVKGKTSKKKILILS